jgi:predicted DNA-binding protein with PD1-like motif
MIVYIANAEKVHLAMFADIGAVATVLISYFRTSPNQARDTTACMAELKKEQK